MRMSRMISARMNKSTWYTSEAASYSSSLAPEVAGPLEEIPAAGVAEDTTDELALDGSAPAAPTGLREEDMEEVGVGVTVITGTLTVITLSFEDMLQKVSCLYRQSQMNGIGKNVALLQG
jgi:hypothetical protein